MRETAGSNLDAKGLLDRRGQLYIDCVRSDLAFHCFVAAYALVGFAVALVAGVPHKFVPLSYLVLLKALPQLVLFVVAIAGLWSLATPTPLRSLQDALRVPFGPETVAGLLLFASLAIYMGVFTSIKTMLTDIVPFFADALLADLDRLLHGKDPWLYARALLAPEWTPTLERFYFGVWGVLLPGSLLAVLLLPGLRTIRKQFVWTVLLIWPLLGNLVAAAMMSAGPVYFELVTGDARFAGLAAHLSHYSAGRDWAAFLWSSYISGSAGAGSGISAFPSLHLASVTLFALLANRVHRQLFWLALTFVAVILFGSVYLGWHYAVDGYFSVGATVLIWKSVGWALRRSDGVPQRSQ